MAEWVMKKLKDIADFNPRESLAKGVVAKKVAMDKLQPFCRDIPGYELEPFSGGTKFRNGDTIMARITPCLENGKTAKVAVLDDGEVGFGSTEYIVFRAKDGIDEDFIYYLVCSPLVREPAIKSMVGSSGRQRVQTDVVQNLEIMVPDYEEQKRISAILKSLDDKIAANTEVNKNLLEQAQSIFTQEFLMLDRIPDLVKLTEWNEQHIKERAKLLAEKAEQIWTYPEITAAELAPYQVEEKPAQKYTIDSYDINAFTRTLFDMLDRRICNLSPDVKREFKKLYIAYKLDTNFVDIVVQKQRLRISLNMKFSEIHDPKGLCKDITGLGRWGNGDVEVFFEHTSEIDDVMELIEQSYKKQADE